MNTVRCPRVPLLLLGFLGLVAGVLPLQHAGPGFSAPAARAASPAQSDPASFVAGRLIVQFRPGVYLQSDTLRTGRPTLDAILTGQRVLSAASLFAGLPSEGQSDPRGLARIYILRLPLAGDVLAAVAALSADPNVEWAEPDYLAYSVDTTPNDPLFPDQWGLAKIAAPAGWDVVTGTATVAIAIVDSGLQLDHPDLATNCWTNPGEVPGDGIDNDNNGFIDDVDGWDFVNDDNDPADDNGHGTQVAGVAAAVSDNGTGIAGVCWNCQLMPVKVMSAGGVANYSAIAQGILYAAQKGARVINLSLGGYSDSQAVRAAVQSAVDDHGTVIVAGAGNDSSSAPFYPAAYPEVLAVAGTDNIDLKWPGSNYGSWVDVTAPAVAITTTYMGSDYGPADGTSFSTAFVSGLAGLVRSQQPGWTPALVQAQIYHTADPIDALNPGYTGLLGSGRINAAHAVTQASHPILEIAATAVNGDPLGRPAPGATSTLEVTLGNGWLDASGVMGMLATADPNVTILTGTASYGNISAGGTGTGVPLYHFTIVPTIGYNYPIPFSLEVTANGGDYTVTLALTITTRSAEEPVGGTIFTNTTWTHDKTYIVQNNVGIMPGVTLTIEPGTEVLFNADTNMNVAGTLIAAGTADQPIDLQGHDGASWGWVYFDDSSVDATATVSGTYLAGNVLRWVQVQSATNGIGCNIATPYLSHVTMDGGGMNCIAGQTRLWLLDSDLGGNVTIDAGADVPEVTGLWTTRASMPTARYGLGVTMVSNGKLYAIGGYDEGVGSLATVEEYDPATDTWTTRAPMPTARYELGVAAASNGKLYAIGGYGPLATVEEYDPATDTWTTRTPMPTARRGLGVAAASNGKLYAIGGCGGPPDYSVLATVEEYDPATDIWTTRAPMPTARHQLGVVVASNGKLYAIGGDNDSDFLTMVEEYDPATDTWTTRAPMPTARSNFGAAAGSNGKLYTIGGIGIIATVEEYDPATDTWTTRASMPTARYDLGVAAASNGKLYAIGGYNGAPLVTVEEFTLPSSSFAYSVHNTTIRSGNLSLPQTSQVLTSTIGGSITAGSASTVQNTTAHSITINGSGMVVDCTVGGNISLSSGSVLSNTIQGGGISAGDGSLVHSNNVENAPGWGISASGNVTLTLIHNRVVGCANGVNVGGGIIQGNLIANSTGIGLQVSGGAVISNTLTGNGGNALVIAAGAPTMTVHGNNLEFNYGSYDLVNNTVNPIDASGNWWGITDSAAIEERVYDFLDDFNLGRVTHAPVQAGPVSEAPAYVRSVTLTPPSPVGIETVAFDVEFSRPMDAGSSPQISFWGLPYWTPRANMPTVRADLGVAAASNGNLYAIGGYYSGTGSLATVEEYDPATDTWTTRAPMLTARALLGVAAASNGKIYAIGGYGDAGRLATVEEYDPATDTWTTRTPMPTARSGLRVAAASNGKLYAIGGTGGAGRLATVEEYDPATDTWTTRASMPTARYELGVAAASNGKIYAIGGHDGGSLATVEEYDPATDTWTTRASMPTSRAWLGVAAASNGNLYAIGGADGGPPLATVEEYDPATDTWTTCPSMPTARWGLGVVTASNGKLYAIGGASGGSHFATVEELTLPLGPPAFYDGHWLSSIQYRAYYDITALVPRGTYTVTVAEAIGADGLEIAPNSAYTFTVDYAGGVGDTTPPLQPTVLACGADSPDTLSAQWFAYDPDSEITLYRYAIGSTPGGTDVINWTDTPNTSVLRTGLNLITGQTYYVAVQARNEGGLWSEAGVSSGVVAGAGTCPDAVFGADPVSGTVPLTVQFTDASTGTVEIWLWDLGDGVTSTLPNPAHTYTTIGVYTVSLLVSGPGGSDLLVRPNYITVTAGTCPDAVFGADPVSGTVPLAVQFTDASTGTVEVWLWDLGDGVTSTLPNPAHTYTTIGVYTVSLLVSGPGGSDLLVRPNYITVTPPAGGYHIYLPLVLRGS